MYIQNPLDEFNTYSVHYVMLACRTTVTAQAFASDDDKAMAASLAAIDKTSALGQPVILNNNATDVFLVIDTRRFSQFTVESLKYDVLINGLQKNAGTSNLAVDLSMTILDSVGISFANFLQWLMDKQMKTNYDGLIFMLRTIFVGHKPDGTSETVQSETIPMHLSKMEINLDFAKGAYNLEFMPNMNFDVNRYERFLSISLKTTYSTGKGNKLGGIVANLENELNKASQKYYNDIQEIIEKSGSTEKLGRPVQYMITLPSERWADFEVLGATAGGSSEIRWVPQAEPVKKTDKATTATNTSTAPSGQLSETITAVKPSLAIPKVLDLIFKQTPQIARLGNFQTNTQNTDGFVTFFKYIVGITSDDKTMMVHVDVVEFKVPNIFAQKQPKSKSTSVVSQQEDEFYTTTTSPTGIIKREPKNFLEYDYIFTGRNKDILNFDMKIQDFQFLLASNLRIGDNAIRNVGDDGKIDKTAVSDGANDLLYTRKYDPILMPRDTKAALENFSNYTIQTKTPEQAQQLSKESQQYTKNLSMFYAGSPITVALTIKGNPLIMHKFNMGKLLKHPETPSGSGGGIITGSSRTEYRTNLEKEILRANGGSLAKRGDSFVMQNNLDTKSYAVAPVFVKLNIMGPNVNFQTNEQSKETDDFATSVLSDNYYIIFKVTNIIQGGAFTQELELYSHNIFGRTSTTKDDNSNANPGTR